MKMIEGLGRWLLPMVLSAVACLAWGEESAKELNPVVPFLAVTGKPTEQDLVRKVAALQADGYDQFLIYARSGLQYRYMGEEWLKTVETLCREAEARGMKAWLYDEYNWPSGTCKGCVPNEKPEYRYREWAVYRNPDGTYRWQLAYAPAGWVDVCDYGAVKRFIELTHEVYEKRLAKYFASKTIPGIFTDEPGHPTSISFEGRPKAHFSAWNGLEDEYRAATGRDFRADAEAYWNGKSGPEVWETYSELKGRRFRASYFDQIRAWCDKMGIVSTGHMIAENELGGSCAYNGNPLHALKGESMPGMDEISSRCDWRLNTEWITLGVMQHAATRNGRGGLVELYALGPNDMTPARLRQMIWLEAMFGVDHYLVSMQVMDHRGLVEKHGYLSPIQEGQPWHGQLRGFFAEAKKAARYARRTDHLVAAAVRYPQKAAARFMYAGGKRPKLWDLLREMSGRQMAFDLVEESEKTDRKFVFETKSDGTFREERTGRTFATAAEAVTWLAAETPARVRYLERDGSPAVGLIVREYPDGSSAALDILNTGDRQLTAVIDGARYPCLLPSRGVLALGAGEKPAAPFVGARAAWAPQAAAYRLDRANVRRLPFNTNRVVHVVTGAGVKRIRLVLRTCAMKYAVTGSGRPVDEFEAPPEGEKVFRHDAVPYSFAWDGRPIATTRPCTALPVEYRGLYAETDEIEVTPGAHELRLVTGESDQNFFLPAAFAAGEFAVRDGALVKLPEKLMTGLSLVEQGLGDYCGEVTYVFSGVKPPEANALVELGTGGLFARVAWNDRDLGVVGWGPFRWRIGNADTKPGQLAVTLYTPVVSICGDVDRADAQWDIRFWVHPHDRESVGGVMSAAWLTGGEARPRFVECETFRDHGGWVVDPHSMKAMGSSYLMAHGYGRPVADATTVVNFCGAAKYHVWVRTRDWSDEWRKGKGTAPGRFQIVLRAADQEWRSIELGREGRDWHWQKAGDVELPAGDTTVALHDLTGFNGRCDAIYFTADPNDVPPNGREELARYRPAKRHFRVEDAPVKYDLVVVGGGMAGMCTAMSAARQGVKTLLLQDRGVLGGCNSSEVRVSLGGVCHVGDYPNLGRLVDEFAPAFGGNKTYPAEWYEDVRKENLFRRLPESACDLKFHEHVYAVEMEGTRIKAVLSRNTRTGHETRWTGALFCDATGDAVVARLAGCETMYGRDAKSVWNEPSAPEKPIRQVMGHSVQWYTRPGAESEPFPDIDWGLAMSDENCYYVRGGDWEQEAGQYRDMADDTEAIRDWGLYTIYSNWSWLKNHSARRAEFVRDRMAWVSPIGGKRESYRVVGDHVLTQVDVESHASYPDLTAPMTWNIDLHFPDPENEAKFPEPFRSCAYHRHYGGPYAVPYRCLYARDCANLFLAGRHISCSHIAFAAVRVMRTLGMLGEVAGMAAAICRKHGCLPRDVYTAHLDELKERMRRGVPGPGVYHSGGCAGDNEFYHFKDTGHFPIWPDPRPLTPRVKSAIEKLGLDHRHPHPEIGQ